MSTDETLLTEVRMQRTMLLSASNALREALAQVVLRSQDEPFATAVDEFCNAVQKHVLLASYLDKHDTERPAPDPESRVCGECKGSGSVTSDEVGAPVLRVCLGCHGVGALQ